jgi:outer membrane protein W
VKKVLIFVAILMICASSMVNAQDLTGMFNISPYAGLGIPMGKMSDTEGEDALARTTGFKFGANAEYFFTPNIGAGVDFMYAIFGNDYTQEEIDLYGDDKLNTMNIGVHGKYVFMPEGMLRPYITAGIGMTMNKLKDAIDEEGQTVDAKLDAKLFIAGGIGAMYWVSEMISVFGEADFDFLMTKDAKVKIEDVEVGEVTSSYNFLDFKVGLSVWFGGSE